MKRGFCSVGIWYPQKEENIGTLFRSALAFNADFVFTIGRKYSRQSSDTCHATRHLPCHNYLDRAQFEASMPLHSRLICIEIAEKAHSLPNFAHPEQAIYLLGSEGGGLPEDLMRKSMVVSIPTTICLNVASAGTVVLYDRLAKSKSKENLCS